jgi:hypothetical protein
MASKKKSKKEAASIVTFKRCFGSIYKCIAHHQTEQCQKELGGGTKSCDFKIQFGKIIEYQKPDLSRLWMFHENLNEEQLTIKQETFDKLWLETHSQANEQKCISKCTTSKHIYVFNGWRYTIDKLHSEPKIEYRVETDFVADFLCALQDTDIRFVCEKYTSVETNAPTLKYYDSIHEQHVTRYTFYDAIHVDFIVEFDITRAKKREVVEDSRINRINIEIDRQLSFDDDESKALFEQILSLIVFDQILDSHQHTYNLVRKFCNK